MCCVFVTFKNSSCQSGLIQTDRQTDRQTDTRVLRGSVTPVSISIKNGRNLNAIKTKTRRGVKLHKENSNKMQQCIKILLFHIYMKLKMFWGDTPSIIRSLKLQWQPLVFHTWKVVGRVLGGRCQAHCAWQRPPTTRPTTFHVWKPRGCHCSFRLLMMGGVSPETCRASHKYGIIKKKLIHCCILLDFSLWIVLWCTDPRTSRVVTHIYLPPCTLLPEDGSFAGDPQHVT